MKKLIDPISLELAAKDFEFVSNNSDFFKDLGFELEVFGKNTLLVRTIPNILGKYVDKTFLLDCIDEMATVEKQDKQIIAIYHTHPAPPRPSNTDLSFMEVNPYIWLISSTSTPEQAKGYYLLNNQKLIDIEVEIIRNEKMKRD